MSHKLWHAKNEEEQGLGPKGSWNSMDFRVLIIFIISTVLIFSAVLIFSTVSIIFILLTVSKILKGIGTERIWDRKWSGRKKGLGQKSDPDRMKSVGTRGSLIESKLFNKMELYCWRVYIVWAYVEINTLLE